MKKHIWIIALLLFWIYSFLPTKVLAIVPPTNRMKLGDISPLFPVTEMRAYYQKMEPVYLKYFGPPFSDINLNIIASPDAQSGSQGFSTVAQSLELGYQAKEYNQIKINNPVMALDNIKRNMRHELSHGMYYWGNEIVHYDHQWIYEGWAKLFETKLEQNLEKDMGNISTQLYLSYYMDKEAVAGTPSWGSHKIRLNHSLVYNMTTITHFLLSAAGSTTNNFLDFPKRYNDALYDYATLNNTHRLSDTDVKKILDQLLPDTTIDGVKASDWYFQSPAAYSNGKPGYHLGVTTEDQQITAFVFIRKETNNVLSETPLEKIAVKIEVVDVDGKVITSGTSQTNADGEASIASPNFESSKLYSFKANTTIQGQTIEAQSYYYDAPNDQRLLSGILVDESGKAVDKKYVGLLQADTEFSQKDNGLFTIEVPEGQRVVTLDFLGDKQEVTKGSFARVYFMKIPKSYLAKAANLPEEEFTKGIVANTRPPAQKEPQNEKLIIAVAGLLTVLFLGFMVYLYKKRLIIK